MKPILYFSLEFFNLLFLGLLFLSHVFRGRRTSRANTLLSVALFGTVYSSGILLLIDSRLILELPHLYRTGNIFMYLSYPLGYLYVVHILSQQPWQKRDWLHLIPTLIYIIDYLPFFLLDGASKRTLIEADFQGQTTYLYNQGWIFPAGFHFVFRTIFFSVYCALAYRGIYQAYRASVSFREENKSLLAWLTVYTSFLAINCVPLIYFLLVKTTVNLTQVANTLASTSALLFAIYLFMRPDILYGIRGLWVDLQSGSATEKSSILVKPAPANDYATDNNSLQTAVQPMKQSPVVAVVLEPQEDGEQVIDSERKKVYLREEVVQQIAAQVNRYMEQDQPFLKKRFSISDLSAAIKVPAHQLSAYLNNFLGTSFSDFVNEKRIRYLLQQVAENPGLSRYTLEALALHAGFTNRFTFLNAFKKFTGKNPSEYFRNQRLGEG